MSKSVAGKQTVYIGTWENRNVPTGSFQEAEEATRKYGVSVVGLIHSRGVGRVMPGESLNIVSLEGVSSLTQREEDCHARRDPGFQFTSLAHLLNVEYLRDCYKSLNRNKAVGIDNVSWEEYGKNLEENLKLSVSKLRRKKYKPMPARRVYIPKSETGKRPLGISALESKIVERGITWILESIYEQDFLNCSYGFRPKRNSHQALKELNDLIMFQPVNHIVGADIKGFFDNVSHEKLMESIRIRIKDTTLLNLIKKFLKAGYVDDGILVKLDTGVPQVRCRRTIKVAIAA
ncbi:MAG: reverse transcriptase domain-containing protein [Candidatus Scalindua sp.]